MNPKVSVVVPSRAVDASFINSIPVKAESGKNNFISFLSNNGEPYYVSTTCKEFVKRATIGSLLDIHGQIFRIKRRITCREYRSRYKKSMSHPGGHVKSDQKPEVAWYELTTD